jgi:nucleotide-binding universal stress UspA family protein
VTKKILLGYDDSQSAGYALDFAAELARAFSAELHVLAVARPPEFGDDVEARAVLESSIKHCEAALKRARAALGGSPFPTQFHVATGHPAEKIVSYAEAHGVDHIVVGHRGRSLLERWLLGSVARQVIVYAHCAVSVIKQPPTRAASG